MSLRTPTKLQKLQETLYATAKQRPTQRFYSLYDKVYREDILEHAYALSRRKAGAAGVDGQTFVDIEAQGVERWLGQLREELKQGHYRPQAVRRVMIPKAGGVGERPLGIPTIRDRVVQTAAKLILEPIFEADFDPAAYGYRPRRSALDAVEHAHKAVIQGCTEVIDADLARYFDTIPHSELMKCLARRISDGKMLHLIKMWIKVPVEEKDDQGNRRMIGGKKSTRGTPQGGVISPLLANIYMHRFIKALRKSKLDQQYGIVLVNYADDFVLLCRRGARQMLEVVRRWMSGMGLALNDAKTCVRDARRESFDFLGYTIGPTYAPHGGRWYLGAKPSKKALRRICQTIHQQLDRRNCAPWEEIATRLNQTLRGWVNYFRYGTIGRARRSLDRYVCERVRHLLTRRHKLQGRGVRVFPAQRIHGELGVYRVSTAPKKTAHAAA